MLTDWTILAKKIGSLQDDGSESGGDSYAQKALGEILGNEWIESTVEHIISFRRGQELAMNCLRYLQSTKATHFAYKVYKSADGERADRAVWLIKHIASPNSFDWIEEFLNDQNVIHQGLGLLDQLLWAKQVPYDNKTKSLLELAETNSNGKLKDQTDIIRQYLEERNSR